MLKSMSVKDKIILLQDKNHCSFNNLSLKVCAEDVMLLLRISCGKSSYKIII